MTSLQRHILADTVCKYNNVTIEVWMCCSSPKWLKQRLSRLSFDWRYTYLVFMFGSTYPARLLAVFPLAKYLFACLFKGNVKHVMVFLDAWCTHLIAFILQYLYRFLRQMLNSCVMAGAVIFSQ